MAKTIAEKILSQHAQEDLKALDVAVCKVDFCYSQDGTSTLVIDSFNTLQKERKSPFLNYHMVIDHNAPSPTQGISQVHKKMRDFCKQYNLVCHDVGEGVCHEVIASNTNILPGQLVCGADSHTCTLGALGAFATGMGSTDIAFILATGENWFKVPESVRINLQGSLQKGVYVKDLILYIIGRLKADGCTYKSIEYHGPAIKELHMDSRFTIANMSVEMGAKTGIFIPDDITLEWLEENNRVIGKDEKDKIGEFYPDTDAIYWKEIDIKLDKISPQVAIPHRVDNVRSVSEVEGIPINQVYIGTCTNGRLQDLRIAAQILRDNKVHPETKLIIAPASKKIYVKALQEGLIETLIKSGASIVTPGCGPCVGSHCGIPADDENVLSTANRNFKGRMGNPNAFIYLGSPATAASSCIEGKITDPRQYL